MIRSMAGRIVIGIDAGSAAVSAVAMDERGELLASAYEFHRGRISACWAALPAARTSPPPSTTVAR